MTGPSRWSSPASLIRLEGPDARRFLHGQSSQSIELAPPGSCLATCLISPTGRMRALALVQVDGSGVDLVVIAGDGAAVHQSLDRVLFPADQVQLGPVEAITLVRMLGATEAAGEASTLRPPVDLGGGRDQPVLLLRQSDSLPSWAEALPELSGEQAERQRLRAGFPAAPGELNDSTNPFELGLAEWVSLSKGCYVGQETLAKLATYDGVKQQLRHWRAGRTGPAAADALSPGTPLTTAAGERAGVITSTLAGPDGVEGLALVRRQTLAEAQLLAGDGAAAVPLELRVPSGFVAPPVGDGGSSGPRGG